MKRVLIITWYWPPSGGAGVQRWLKFSKYLPSYGWEPVILTVDPAYASYPQTDDRLIDEISPSMEVFRTKAPTGIFSAYKKITGSSEIPYGGFVNESNPGLLRKLLRFIRGNFFLPDSRRGWNRYAYKAALNIIKEKQIDAVITTSPPHSTQLTGLKLSKKLKIKWIADLRDPWTEIYYSDELYQTPPARWINSSLEASVLNRAGRVITTCQATADLFRKKIRPSTDSDKVMVITNGYDETDFEGEKGKPDRFAITYLGTLAASYDLSLLTSALRSYSTLLSEEILLRFIGKADAKVIRSLEKVQGVRIELFPYVPHTEAISWLARSAALLLVIPAGEKSTEMIPGKLFEYLASRRPVIAIGRKGSDVDNILRETSGGRLFGPEESGELAAYISDLMSDFSGGRYETNPAGIGKYSRQALTATIAGILDSL